MSAARKKGSATQKGVTDLAGCGCWQRIRVMDPLGLHLPLWVSATSKQRNATQKGVADLAGGAWPGCGCWQRIKATKPVGPHLPWWTMAFTVASLGVFLYMAGQQPCSCPWHVCYLQFTLHHRHKTYTYATCSFLE